MFKTLLKNKSREGRKMKLQEDYSNKQKGKGYIRILKNWKMTF